MSHLIKKPDGQFKLLEDLERQIHDAVFGIGEALWKIKHHDLWKKRGFDRFQDYTKVTFGYGTAYSYQLIKTHEVEETLSTIVEKGGIASFQPLSYRETARRKASGGNRASSEAM